LKVEKDNKRNEEFEQEKQKSKQAAHLLGDFNWGVDYVLIYSLGELEVDIEPRLASSNFATALSAKSDIAINPIYAGVVQYPVKPLS